MKLVASFLLFIFAWSFIALAQSPSPSPSPSPAAVSVTAPVAAAVVSTVGIMGWITSHGGFQASVLLLVSSFFAILSGVRTVLYKFDGVNPGDAIPVGDTKLTWVNKICVIAGQVIDYITGNTQH